MDHQPVHLCRHSCDTTLHQSSSRDRGQRLNIARRCNLWRVGKSSWGSENGRFTDTEMVNLIQKLEKKEWGCTIFSIPTMPIFIAPTWLKYAKYSWDSSIMFLFSELSQLSSVKMIPERASQPGSMVQLGPTKAPSPTLTSGTKRQETHLQKHLHIWLYTYIGVYIYMTMHIYIYTISMSIYIYYDVLIITITLLYINISMNWFKRKI